MSFLNEQTLYDQLEVSPNSTQEELRDAYLRLKSLYSKKSNALYTVISDKERENTLKEIENAYTTLRNEDQREKYDLSIGVKKLEDYSDQNFTMNTKVSSENDTFGESTDILEIPTVTETSITKTQEKNSFESSIQKEIHWRGSFLKKVREFRDLSIEEISEKTKISKSYLKAIELEDYKNLPASVYLRGFVITLAKHLKLPYNEVCKAYMARYRQNRTGRS